MFTITRNTQRFVSPKSTLVNWPVMQTQCVISKMRTEFLNIIYMSFTLNGFMFLVNLFVALSLIRKHRFMLARLRHVPSFRIKLSYDIIRYFLGRIKHHLHKKSDSVIDVAKSRIFWTRFVLIIFNKTAYSKIYINIGYTNLTPLYAERPAIETNNDRHCVISGIRRSVNEVFALLGC